MLRNIVVVKMSVIFKRWNEILMKCWGVYDVVNLEGVEIDDLDYVKMISLLFVWFVGFWVEFGPLSQAMWDGGCGGIASRIIGDCKLVLSLEYNGCTVGTHNSIIAGIW